MPTQTDAKPLTDEELSTFLDDPIASPTNDLFMRDLASTIEALQAERDALHSKLSEIYAGCDIQKAHGLYRQVPVVIGPGKTQHQLDAEAAQAELPRLRANQRTPGTIEVCPVCHAHGPFPKDACPGGPEHRYHGMSTRAQCPLRAGLGQEKKG